MAFASEFHMPGAYHFDGPTPSSQPLSAAMFRPPMSPSASSSVYNLAKSTGSLYSDVSMANTPAVGAKRKRTRADVRTDLTPTTDWNTNANTDSVGAAHLEDRSHGGATEIRYTLAGQIETPGGAPHHAENGILDDSIYSDIDYRRALGPKRQRDEMESPSAGPSGRRPETESTYPPQPVGWSTLALHTIGGVVGKVWEFCRTGGFRGFHAGGGVGYEMNGVATPLKEGGSQNGRQWCNEHDIPTLQADDPLSPTPLNEHNVPGGFPQSEYVSLHELSTPESTPRPAAKRRQISETREDLRRNWVIVDEPTTSPVGIDQVRRANPPAAGRFAASSRISTSASRPSIIRSTHHQPRYSTPTASSGSRRISVPVSRLGGNPSSTARTRTSLRISHAGSPALSAREPASYAAPRSPVTSSFQNPASPSRIPIPVHPAGSGPNPFAVPGTTTMASRPSSRQSLSRCSSPAPAGRGHRRNTSNASAASGRVKAGPAAVDGIKDSPRLTAEAKQLAVKKIAAERDADAKMEAFNRRLMDMIRQGKEALGTTIEVDMEYGAAHGDVGWEDDE